MGDAGRGRWPIVFFLLLTFWADSGLRADEYSEWGCPGLKNAYETLDSGRVPEGFPKIAKGDTEDSEDVSCNDDDQNAREELPRLSEPLLKTIDVALKQSDPGLLSEVTRFLSKARDECTRVPNDWRRSSFQEWAKTIGKDLSSKDASYSQLAEIRDIFRWVEADPSPRHWCFALEPARERLRLRALEIQINKVDQQLTSHGRRLNNSSQKMKSIASSVFGDGGEEVLERGSIVKPTIQAQLDDLMAFRSLFLVFVLIMFLGVALFLVLRYLYYGRGRRGAGASGTSDLQPGGAKEASGDGAAEPGLIEPVWPRDPGDPPPQAALLRIKEDLDKRLTKWSIDLEERIGKVEGDLRAKLDELEGRGGSQEEPERVHRIGAVPSDFVESNDGVSHAEGSSVIRAKDRKRISELERRLQEVEEVARKAERLAPPQAIVPSSVERAPSPEEDIAREQALLEEGWNLFRGKSGYPELAEHAERFAESSQDKTLMQKLKRIPPELQDHRNLKISAVSALEEMEGYLRRMEKLSLVPQLLDKNFSSSSRSKPEKRILRLRDAQQLLLLFQATDLPRRMLEFDLRSWIRGDFLRFADDFLRVKAQLAEAGDALQRVQDVVLEALKRADLEHIPIVLGQTRFDSKIHIARSDASERGVPDGVVVGVVRTGFKDTRKDKVVQRPEVVVNRV